MRIFETEILKSLTLNNWNLSLKLGNTQNPSFYSNVVSGNFSASYINYHNFLAYESNNKRLWSFFGSNTDNVIYSYTDTDKITRMTVIKNKYTYSENKKSDILCCTTTNNKVLLTTNPKGIPFGSYDFSRFGDSTHAPSVLHDIDNNNEYVYVVGEDGYIAYSNDNGYTFNQIQFEYPIYFGCVVAFPGVYVSTYNKNVTAIACSRPMHELLCIAIISNDEIVDYRVFNDTAGLIDVTYKNNFIIGISQGQQYYSTTFLYDIVNGTYSNLYNIDREEQYEIFGIENINGKLIVLSNNNRLLKSENGQVWEEEDLSAYLPSSHNFRGIAKYGNMVSLVTEDGYVLYKNF